ncbi:pantetheine-phosphate adenylyltransferase [Luteococcus sp. H101]|uniref:pantetheine-phosphate adenylyltransferase n=1 Tax=unclassified Luteococcus TaxID=2639923 RepID=UPI00406C6B90
MTSDRAGRHIKAIVPGSFDPITKGHLDVIERATKVFDEVLVAVGRNSQKASHMFDQDERIALVREATAHLDGVQVGLIEGLLVDYAKAQGCGVIVKGLRFASDFDYELQMAHINTHVSGIETVFLPAGGPYATISSTMMREIAGYGGDVSEFVTPNVAQAIQRKVAERQRG